MSGTVVLDATVWNPAVETDDQAAAPLALVKELGLLNPETAVPPSFVGLTPPKFQA
jgi:hypothetical protein